MKKTKLVLVIFLLLSLIILGSCVKGGSEDSTQQVVPTNQKETKNKTQESNKPKEKPKEYEEANTELGEADYRGMVQ